MSWTNQTQSSSSPFPPPVRLFFTALTVVLVLVSGLLGLMAAVLMLSFWPIVRPSRRLDTETEPTFRFIR